MASNVVVIDAALKRAQIKVTPQTYLSDVLEEACKKLGHKPDQYTLKHGDRNVDLSRSIRLSGLTNAAKLNLVQSSRSPSVVSVALQPSDTSRLTDKFPSNTSIWQILRRFEAGVAGAAEGSVANHNFTQRATPQISGGTSSGSGRLCYEMPVVNAMGRELASFVDLQKTLGQLGFNSGTCLLRLNFRNTDKPLEEAMNEISQYFKEAKEPQAQSEERNDGAHAGGVADMQSAPSGSEVPLTDTRDTRSPPDPDVDMSDTPTLGNAPMTSQEAETTSSVEAPPPTVVPGELVRNAGISASTEQPQSDISIFAPPSSSIPAAAATYNEADYIPTVAHAQLHQARLEKQSRNRKLPSDKELEAEAQAQTDALKQVREVVVRIRFPDNAQAQRGFGQQATTSDVYALCRELMHRPDDEDFKIRYQATKSTETLEDGSKKLILDLGWKGRVLVTVIWGENVSRRGPALKQEHLDRAQQLNMAQPRFAEQQEEAQVAPAPEEPAKEKKGGDRESKMKNLLSRLSKK